MCTVLCMHQWVVDFIEILIAVSCLLCVWNSWGGEYYNNTTIVIPLWLFIWFSHMHATRGKYLFFSFHSFIYSMSYYNVQKRIIIFLYIKIFPKGKLIRVISGLLMATWIYRKEMGQKTLKMFPLLQLLPPSH